MSYCSSRGTSNTNNNNLSHIKVEQTIGKRMGK